MNDTIIKYVAIISAVTAIIMLLMALYYYKEAQNPSEYQKQYDRYFKIFIGIFSVSSGVFFIDLCWWWINTHVIMNPAYQNRADSYMELSE
jgi:hypothetical protein